MECGGRGEGGGCQVTGRWLHREKRIQFLQEAAIMGQFKHPNVITTLCVNFASEPVCAMCYVTHGVPINIDSLLNRV